MKKNIGYFAAACMLLLAAASCNSLDTNTDGLIVSTTFYKTESDADAAVLGCYAGLIQKVEHGYFKDLFYMTEMTGDNVSITQRWSGTGTNFDQGLWESKTAEFNYFWQVAYREINTCNLVVDKVPTIAMDTVKRNRLVGEAKFLRALMYFNLVRLFGDVPLHLTGQSDLSESTLARTPSTAIYAQIIADLQYAATNCYKKSTMSGDDKARVSSTAAKSLLGLVYLTQAGYPLQDDSNLANAESLLKEVIDSKEYSLNNDYMDNFDASKGITSEEVFYAHTASLLGTWGTGSVMGHYAAPSGYPGLVNSYSWGELACEPQWVISKFDTAHDQRAYNGMILDWTTSNGSTTYRWDMAGGNNTFQWPYLRKFSTGTGQGGWGDIDIPYPIMRYADVLLLYAEVASINHKGTTSEAIAAVQQVRNRAYNLDGSNPPDLGFAAMTADQFQAFLVEERGRELYGEWHRWFDLVRWGLAGSHMNSWASYVNSLPATGSNGLTGYNADYNISDYKLLFPIPYDQIQLNKNLTQNEGYN